VIPIPIAAVAEAVEMAEAATPELP